MAQWAWRWLSLLAVRMYCKRRPPANVSTPPELASPPVRVEGTGVDLVISAWVLGEHSSNANVGGINLHDELSTGVRLDQDGGWGEALF